MTNGISSRTISTQIFTYKGKDYHTMELALEAQEQDEKFKKKVAEIPADRIRLLSDDLDSDAVRFYEIKSEGADGPSQHLAYVSGSLQKVKEYAVRLKGFYGYGPGYITQLSFINVDKE